jgi:hypothetical protein
MDSVGLRVPATPIETFPPATSVMSFEMVRHSCKHHLQIYTRNISLKDTFSFAYTYWVSSLSNCLCYIIA